MSFEGLLVHTVVVYNPDFAFTDRYGNPIASDAVAVTEKALVQPLPGSEDVIDRDTRRSRFQIFFRRSSVVTGLSNILWESRHIKIDGEPRVHDYGTVPHIEASGVEYLG